MSDDQRGQRLLDELVPAIRGLSVEDWGPGGPAWRQRLEDVLVSAVRDQEPAREGQPPPEAAAQEEDEEGPEGRRTRRRTERPPAQRPAEEGEEEEELRVREGSQSYKGVWFLDSPLTPGDWVAIEWPVKGRWQEGQVLRLCEGDAWVRMQWKPSPEFPASRWGPHESWERRAKLWRRRAGPPRVD